LLTVRRAVRADGGLATSNSTGSFVAGMSDRASALAAQGTWEPEARQDAGVHKLRDRGDPFAFEG
jgi:hypothetical protein